MPYERPTRPTDVPTGVVDALDDCSVEQLHRIAEYAEALGEHREREARLRDGEKGGEGESESEKGGGEVDEGKRSRGEGSEEREDEATRADSRPEDVPAKATLTVKEINDNRYHYWQWREGDAVKSKYKGPVEDE